MTVTHSEIISGKVDQVPRVDRSPASARAGARLPVTDSARKLAAQAAVGARRWWGWTSRPPSIRATWYLSRIDEKKIPNGSTPLKTIWLVSNATDRLVMFTLVMLAPSALAGPMRWITQTPTRRIGFYLSTTALFGAYILS